MSRIAIWDGFLQWFSDKYPDVVVSELSGKRMKAIEKEFLEEATKEVEVNEYGEIVSKRENNKGVRLKHHTFYTSEGFVGDGMVLSCGAVGHDCDDCYIKCDFNPRTQEEEDERFIMRMEDIYI